jgi:KaiC/GvpD/RAD55 family RecA-like ATPase
MSGHFDHIPPTRIMMDLPRVLTSLEGLELMLSGGSTQGECVAVRGEVKSMEHMQGKEGMFSPSFLEPLLKGFPRGSNVSIIGPPGAGKTILCENIANDFLINGGNCLYVTLDKSPDNVRKSFQESRANLSDETYNKRLVFIDGFNWLVGKSQENYHVENLANLTELSIRIASAAYDIASPILLIFDSISPLVVYNSENSVIKFLQLLLARMKDWNGMGVYVVQEGVHSDEFCNTVGYLVDGILDMRMKEEKGKIKRYFRIRNLKFASHETRWIPFAIQAKRKFQLKHACSEETK